MHTQELNFPNPADVNLVIYHKNCPDGFGAAFAAWLRIGYQAEYVAALYGDAPPDVKGKHVAIVDFSYPRDVLERMAAEAETLIVLDHHKTAEKTLNGFDNALFDMTQSGAVLAYRWFHFTSSSAVDADWKVAGLQAITNGVDVPIFFKYIQDRDLWTWQLPNSHEFSAALGQRKFGFQSWLDVFLMTLTPTRMDALIEEGRHVITWRDNELRSIAKKARRVRILGIDLMTLNYAGHYHSELGHILCEMSSDNVPATEASLTWFYDLDSRIFRCSLRSSNTGPSIITIAEKFGGGGHHHAAGFEYNGDIRELLTKS